MGLNNYQCMDSHSSLQIQSGLIATAKVVTAQVALLIVYKERLNKTNKFNENTELQYSTLFLSFCSRSIIVTTGVECLSLWLDPIGLLFTAASFTCCWSSPWVIKLHEKLFQSSKFAAWQKLIQILNQIADFTYSTICY